MPHYLVKFDITTVRGSRFTCKQGDILLTCDNTLEELNAQTEAIEKEILQYFREQLTDLVFMLNITSIEPQSEPQVSDTTWLN